MFPIFYFIELIMYYYILVDAGSLNRNSPENTDAFEKNISKYSLKFLIYF